MQNIDKWAGAVAILVLVVGFAWSLLMKDQGGEYSDAIERADDRINEISAAQNLGPQAPPEVENEVRSAYSFQGETRIPEWAFYRRPARLELFSTAVALPPQLSENWIARVDVVRVAENRSTIHKISGRHCAFERAEIVSCSLEMSVGSEDWAKVASFPGAASGAEFSHLVDVSLEPGKAYRYRIVTRGRSTSSIAFSAGADVVTSAATGAVLFPADSIWRVSGAQIGKLDSGGNFVPGRVTIQNSYWDWDSASTKRNTKIITESAQGVPGIDLFGTGYSLERIQDTADGRTVVLKDATGKRMYLKNNADPQPLVPDGWANLDGDPADASEIESDDAETPEAIPDEEKPVEPAKPRPSGGGLFGGGDD
ncbi:MAG: hypothetical protein VX949_09925 [Planctomycetota bacterium]|nr:hypothetical protein [Planctomycetota bacterium]